jgi:hypothetical protein
VGMDDRIIELNVAGNDSDSVQSLYYTRTMKCVAKLIEL